jgi:hypothetical protein
VFISAAKKLTQASQPITPRLFWLLSGAPSSLRRARAFTGFRCRTNVEGEATLFFGHLKKETQNTKKINSAQKLRTSITKRYDLCTTTCSKTSHENFLARRKKKEKEKRRSALLVNSADGCTSHMKREAQRRWI